MNLSTQKWATGDLFNCSRNYDAKIQTWLNFGITSIGTRYTYIYACIHTYIQNNKERLCAYRDLLTASSWPKFGILLFPSV